MKRWIAAALALASAWPAQGQTLASAFEQAWARHPQALALPAEEDAAAARSARASALWPAPPAVSLANRNDRLGQDRGQQEWEAEIAVPLWLPGQQPAQRAEAEQGLLELEARRAVLKWRLAGELRQAWWAVAAARAVRELAQRRFTTAQALEAAVLRRHQAGEAARFDVNLAQNETLAAAAALVEAETQVAAAERALQSLTGRPAPETLSEEATTHARERAADHPLLAAAAATARLARSRLQLAEASRRAAPEIALRVVRARDDFAQPYANSVGVKLTIPFSSEPRVREESAQARAEVQRAEAELALVRARLQLDLAKARSELDAAERRLALAQTRQRLAEENLALAEKAFALGEMDLPTLLRIRASAFEAEGALGQERVALAAARSQFNQIIGVLP